MGKNRYIKLFVLFLQVLCSACTGHQTALTHEPPVLVDALKIKQTMWQDQRLFIGNIVAINGVNINSQVGGMITKIKFHSGKDVKKGDLLIELWDEDVKAAIKGVEAKLYTDDKIFHRMNILVQTGAVSRQDYDVALNSVLVDKAELLKQNALLSERIIRAPFTGHLGIRNVNLGQYITSGTTVTSINQLNPLYLDFQMPENLINWISVGKSIKFKINNDTKYTQGIVVAISGQVNTDTRGLNVRVKFTNPNTKFLPGMAVSVIVYGMPSSHYIIPQSAVVYNPDGEYVYAIEKNNTVKLTKVELGDQEKDNVVIKHGVTDNLLIVSNGTSHLFPGKVIKIRSIQ